jgi:hypothetical protein
MPMIATPILLPCLQGNGGVLIQSSCARSNPDHELFEGQCINFMDAEQ